jgi:hypothetical protein
VVLLHCLLAVLNELLDLCLVLSLGLNAVRQVQLDGARAFCHLLVGCCVFHFLATDSHHSPSTGQPSTHELVLIRNDLKMKMAVKRLMHIMHVNIMLDFQCILCSFAGGKAGGWTGGWVGWCSPHQKSSHVSTCPPACPPTCPPTCLSTHMPTHTPAPKLTKLFCTLICAWQDQ